MVKIVYKALVSAPSKPDKKYFSTAETTITDSETTQDIFATKRTLALLNFLNICAY